jgi:hypothetical protein
LLGPRTRFLCGGRLGTDIKQRLHRPAMRIGLPQFLGR